MQQNRSSLKKLAAIAVCISMVISGAGSGLSQVLALEGEATTSSSDSSSTASDTSSKDTSSSADTSSEESSSSDDTTTSTTSSDTSSKDTARDTSSADSSSTDTSADARESDALDEGIMTIADGDNVNNMTSTMRTGLQNATSATTEWASYLRTTWCDTIGLADYTTDTVPFQWADSGVADTWKFNGRIANVDGDPQTDPMAKPTKDAAGNCDVYSASQLWYALATYGSTAGTTIRIMQDLDLNGANYNWSAGTLSIQGITLQGENGSVIYNVGGDSACFIYGVTDCDLKDLNFENANIVFNGKSHVGIFGDVTSTSGSKITSLQNITITDSLFFNSFNNTSAWNQCYMAPFGHMTRSDMIDCYTIGNKLYGGTGVHVGGTVARADDTYITSSFSVDSTVIAAGEHSGGFISCSDVRDISKTPVHKDAEGLLVVTDCFTNNQVYGNKTTGVFIGAVNLSGLAKFTRCYTSGSVEGKESLGGFIGQINCWGSYGGSDPQIVFMDCYSTSIVGMQNGGTKLGGFAGEVLSPYNATGKISFTNCYAAGEVGSIDTDVSATRTANKDIGGFVGVNGLPAYTTYNNCYYDKQTTAMREWETGTTRDEALNINPKAAGKNELQDSGFNNIAGIKGVLTSDSEKSGKGLASIPDTGAATGFSGMTQSSIEVDTGTSVDLWIYDGGSDTAAEQKHNCMYPQMASFSKGTATHWGKYADMVKAFSFASVSTVHEQVWDYCVNPLNHASMPTTTYDTVRDLTLSFTMTSYVDVQSVDSIVWTKSSATSELYGESVPVIKRLEKVYKEQYDRDYYTADKFAPGIEWLTVKITVNGITGTRRLRVVPTANITPGSDQMALYDGDYYDHASDMYMAYSTGSRMAASEVTNSAGEVTGFTDVTQGFYPAKLSSSVDSDGSKETKRQNIVKNTYENSGGTYKPDGTTVTAREPTAANNYLLTAADQHVKTNFMTGADGTVHDPNSYMFTKFYKLGDIASIDTSVTDATASKRDVLLDLTGLEIDLTDSKNADWMEKLNGLQALKAEDQGRYILEYLWILPDGRYLKDSKMLVIQQSKHTLEVKVQDKDANAVNDALALSIQTGNRDAATGKLSLGTLLTPDFTTPSASTKLENILTGTAAYFGSQKTQAFTDKEGKITAIKIIYHSFDGDQEITIDNPAIGATIEIPRTYYYGTYEQGGSYYAKSVSTIKKYQMLYDADYGMYLMLDNKFDVSDPDTGLSFSRNDVDNDMEVILVVESKETTGTLKLTKTTVGADGNLLATNDAFTFKLTQPTTTLQSGFVLRPATGTDSVEVKLEAGTYKLSEIFSMYWGFSDITVKDWLNVTTANPNQTLTVNEATVQIVAGKTSEVIFKNTKDGKSGGGKAAVTNELTHKTAGTP